MSINIKLDKNVRIMVVFRYFGVFCFVSFLIVDVVINEIMVMGLMVSVWLVLNMV